MKKLVRNIMLSTVLAVSVASSVQAKSRGSIQSQNANDVFASQRAAGTQAYSLEVEDGFYKVYAMDGISKSYDMMVQTDINDAGKKYIVMLPENVRKGKSSGYGYFYQARPVKRGRALMLSPVSINSDGNFVVESENETRAPVVLMSKNIKPKSGYKFMLQGRNGALKGGIFGVSKMKKRSKQPNLRSYPKNGYFAAGNSKHGPELVVADGLVSLFDGEQVDSTFEMIELNGDGMFTGLARSEWDSMAEYEIGFEDVQKLAVFFDTYEGQEEFMLVASPSFRPGQYRMDVFQSGKLSWVKKFFINLFE